MPWIQYLIATIFFLVGAGCVVLVVFQLPGAWLTLALAVVIEFLDFLYLGPGVSTFGTLILGVCLILLIIGEIIEFFAGVVGAQRGGASRRGMIGSLIGGILGAFVFTPVLFFVPLLGALVGAIIGTFAGAVIGELTATGTGVRQTVRPAIGATIGRVFGTVAKVGVAIAVWFMLSIAAFWPA